MVALSSMGTIRVVLLVVVVTSFASVVYLYRYTEAEGEEDLLELTAEQWRIRKILTNSSDTKDPVRGGCLRTLQGRNLVVDSLGAVCKRERVAANGCCPEKSRVDFLSCKTCVNLLDCCSNYEYCISCCMSRDKQVSVDSFHRCSHLCRTSSRSLRGNRYRNVFLKHCYWEDKERADSIESSLIVIVEGRPGESCTAACAAYDPEKDEMKPLEPDSHLPSNAHRVSLPPKLVCYDEVFSRINRCDILNDKFDCNWCTSGEAPYLPSIVDLSAGEAERPGECRVLQSNSRFECGGRHPFHRRLCACLPLVTPS